MDKYLLDLELYMESLLIEKDYMEKSLEVTKCRLALAEETLKLYKEEICENIE